MEGEVDLVDYGSVQMTADYSHHKNKRFLVNGFQRKQAK